MCVSLEGCAHVHTYICTYLHRSKRKLKEAYKTKKYDRIENCIQVLIRLMLKRGGIDKHHVTQNKPIL